MPNITQLPSWQTLRDLQSSAPALSSLFASDPTRFQQFSVRLPGVIADFSKTPLTQELRDALTSLLAEAGFSQARDDLFSGKKINVTEDRAVLHMALRAPAAGPHPFDQQLADGVQKTLMRMRFFANTIRNGEWRGHSGREITDIVNLGIGGSVLGPQLATGALAGYHHPRLRCHFVSNIDTSDLQRVLKELSPETTLFIIASKTFTTMETMRNAQAARRWLLSHFQDDAAVAAHFVAASTNALAVKAFGISPDNMFPFEDWVGGRYSVWSAIGLCVMVMIGPDRFSEFLAGAYEGDTHFQSAPLAQNIPVLMALTGLWYRNFMNCSAYAVIPYHTLLRRFPAWLQQLDMESNGKSVTREGATVPVKTGPMIFGEPGTDSQHIFFQWLHQGTDIVPVDFIASCQTPYDTAEQSKTLLANMLAQSAALMTGRDSDQPQRQYPGNRPSTTLLFDELTPRALGMLLSFYEHKIFTQGVLWGINSFDQFGVEYGKVLAQALEDGTAEKDASTQGLLDYINRSTSFGPEKFDYDQKSSLG